jgi:cellulose synthase/poly-beta-1,6-N-acetylglucosamine synthase-like glycosyltransferase
MVGGVTILKHCDRKNTIFARVQALDWLFLQGIASGMTGSGRPVSILGNNFAFRRQAYDQTGGFRKIGFSLTEDMALMQAISRIGTWKIKYPLQQETMIFSRPANSWRELYYQRLRWVSGGITGPFTGWILMSTAFLTHLYIILGLAAGSVSVFVALISVLLADLICIVRPLLNRLGWKKLYYYFIVFEVYYLLYTIFMAFLIFIPQKVAWKDRRY